MSAVADLAEAVKNALNGATFAQTFTAERLYLPRVKLEEMGTALSVKVVPRADDRVLQSRGGSVSREIPIDVGVQKKLAAGTNPDTSAANAEIDELVTFVEAVADFLKPGTVYAVAAGRGVIVRTTVEIFYVPEHLAELSIFTSTVRVTLKLF